MLYGIFPWFPFWKRPSGKHAILQRLTLTYRDALFVPSFPSRVFTEIHKCTQSHISAREIRAWETRQLRWKDARPKKCQIRSLHFPMSPVQTFCNKETFSRAIDRCYFNPKYRIILLARLFASRRHPRGFSSATLSDLWQGRPKEITKSNSRARACVHLLLSNEGSKEKRWRGAVVATALIIRRAKGTC
jgi:hypothetical protein